jgi:6-pyruvoyltetrahydropterin/6-carboxytetrahydropterin synthase
MYEVRVKTHFDAAHRIEGYPGKCAQLHGHRWAVEVDLIGTSLSPLNIVIDFSEVKKALKDLIDNELDHHYLNEMLNESCVTAEYLAKWIYNQLAGSAGAEWTPYVVINKVTVWESPDCSVAYYGGVDEKGPAFYTSST